MRVGNQKATINNKIRVIEQIFVLDPVTQNILAVTVDCGTINYVMLLRGGEN